MSQPSTASDVELLGIGVIVAVMERFDQPTRERAFRFIADRYGIRVKPDLHMRDTPGLIRREPEPIHRFSPISGYSDLEAEEARENG